MTIVELQHLLEAHGAEPSRWPPEIRPAALELVAVDPAAADALARARRLDTLIARHLVGRHVVGRHVVGRQLGSVQPHRSREDASDAEQAGRVMAALADPLPPQRRGLLARWWPAELLDLNFAPAWPRIAALAGVAALGFVIGLSDLPLPVAPAPTVVAVADADMSLIIFDSDPLPGARPR